MIAPSKGAARLSAAILFVHLYRSISSRYNWPEITKGYRLHTTPLHSQHVKAGATLVDFSGWEMPLHYGSQIVEHHSVRGQVGIFDVSHMGVIDISGDDACYFLRYVLANDVKRLTQLGQALYTCLLNQAGGVCDDLLVYFIHAQYYRLVVNAATRDKDYAWLQQHGELFDVAINARPDLTILAVQGPNALQAASKVFKPDTLEQLSALKPFRFIMDAHCLIARTGYTGEDGVEIIAPATVAVNLWKKWLHAGAQPCGLAARDTLRLEAGLNLYGADMDETTSPLISNLAWTVCWRDAERNFIGRAALEKQMEQGITQQLVGLIMQQPGVLRNAQKVWLGDNGVGEITSGGFSPTLGHAIALARVPLAVAGHVEVERRGQRIAAQIVKPPFVRHGKKLY